MPPRKPEEEALTADIADLEKCSRAELQRRWKEVFGSTTPARMGRALLRRALAHRMQERALGGLEPATRRRLDRVSKDLAAGRSPENAAPKLKPGTRLLREWQGVVHEVVILEDAVLYRSKEWPSLSAVAREITGARWSGPRFFGLKAKVRDRN